MAIHPNIHLLRLLVATLLGPAAGILTPTALPSAHAQPVAGTTVVTHGFQPDGSFPDWPVVLGEAIVARAVAAGSAPGTVLVYDPLGGDWLHSSGSLDPAGELVLVFDWALDSSWLPGDDDRAGTVHGAAAALATALQAPSLPGALAGTSVLEHPGGGARRLHLIGHSRGAPVNSEVVRRLVSAGVPVDQVTTLDPHPIGPDPDLLDPVPVTWEGVAFADNYWRADGCDFDDPCLGFDFDGMEVGGALDEDLGFLDGLNVIDNRLSPCTLEHLQVHAWYHGTVDLTATDDGDCPIDRPAWYAMAGAGEGFAYSAIGGSPRPCGPTGGCPDAGRVPVVPAAAIVNGDFSFGAGQDAGWRWHGGGGPGEIVAGGGDPHLRLGPTASFRTHDRFLVPVVATAVEVTVGVPVPDPDDVLTVFLTDATGTGHLLATLPLASTQPRQSFTLPIPPALPRPAACSLTLMLDGPAPLGAEVTVDDLDLVIAPTGLFRRGDCNGDGSLDVADPVALLGVLFAGTAAPPCPAACDSNDDGDVDLADVVYALSAIFGIGPLPPPPYPDCGPDGTPDGLVCPVPCP